MPVPPTNCPIYRANPAGNIIKLSTVSISSVPIVMKREQGGGADKTIGGFIVLPPIGLARKCFGVNDVSAAMDLFLTQTASHFLSRKFSFKAVDSKHRVEMERAKV
jgi:hypothetical protein